MIPMAFKWAHPVSEKGDRVQKRQMPDFLGANTWRFHLRPGFLV